MYSTLHTSLSETLKKEWKALWVNSPYATVENSPEWLEASCKAFRYNKKIIVAIRDTRNESLVGVVALVETHLYGLRILTMPALEFVNGISFLGDFSDETFLTELNSVVKGLGSIHLSNFTKEKLDCLEEIKKYSLYYQSDQEFSIDFSKGTFGEYPKRKIQKILRRIKESDNIKIQLTDGKDQAALDTTFKIDISSTKHGKGKGVFWREDVRYFYTLLSEKDPTFLSVLLLYLNDIPISYWIFFHAKNNYKGSQKAYLSGYDQYRPGFLSLIKFLEEVVKIDHGEISLGRGYDRFKTDFSKNGKSLYTIIVSKNIFIRIYFFTLIQLRDKVYRALVQYPSIYANYKLLKTYFLKSK